MTGHNAARRVLGLLAAAPLAGAVVLLAAGPASASITSPTTNPTYTQNGSIQVSATAKSGSASSLSLVDPLGNSRVVAGPAGSVTQSAQLSYSFDTGCYPGCGSMAMNGTWTVKLSGSETDSRTLTLRIPPGAPTNAAARTTASRQITVSWTRGPEPDLTGWAVTDGAGAVLRDGITSSACSNGTCSTAFDYAASDQGDRSFAVVAHRAVCPGCGNILDSSPSATTTATLAPPPPTPTPTPSDSSAGTGSGGTASGGPTPQPTTAGSTGAGGTGTGGSGTGGSGSGTGGTTSSSAGGGTASGGTATGGQGTASGAGPSAIGSGTKAESVQAQRNAFALSFSAFQPKLGIAKLPPLPDTASPTLAGGDELLPDGTYEKTLGYRNVVQREKVTVVGQAARAVGGAVRGALDSQQFMRSLAGALVLLLAGAHLRRWLAQPPK